jgi:hypothetical protein
MNTPTIPTQQTPAPATLPAEANEPCCDTRTQSTCCDAGAKPTCCGPAPAPGPRCGCQ